MSGPNPRLLIMLCIFIGSTLGWYAGKTMGTPVAAVGSLFGAALGWAVARSIVRRIF